MTEIRRRPDQTDEEFYVEVDPFDGRLSDELPRWGCFLIFTALMIIAITMYWQLT